MPARRTAPKLLPGLLIATALAATAAPGSDNAVTLYGAWRSGGGFTDSGSQQSLDLASSAAGAISLDFALDASRQVQWYVSHQRTEVDLRAATKPASAPDTLPLQLTYLHLGGTNFFEGQRGKGPYVVGGLGLTLFSPGLAGLSNEVRPSMNLGLGWQWPLGSSIALRAEARGYLTLVNSHSGFFCSGGCVVSIQGDTLTQGEVQLGLSFGF
ncbi:MAG: hypothetical protein JNL87_16200 [Burkholderiaceae bacterium]|nr:hypothetical protein [Burkholderiaceae bacterium]